MIKKMHREGENGKEIDEDDVEDSSSSSEDSEEDSESSLGSIRTPKLKLVPVKKDQADEDQHRP